MKKNASIVAVGVATRSHLAAASVAMASWHQQHPESARLLYVIDYDFATPESPLLPECLPAKNLLGARFPSTAYALPAVGLCCAMKPHAMLDALERTGADKVVYFDGDVAWYAPPETLLCSLDHHSLTLTPHLLAPVQPGVLPNEAVIRPYGIWNAGIIGARGDAAGRVFLRWWAETMSDPRRLRAETGWDQSWLDFAPVFAASLGVIRDPACNVALWNLAERPLSQTGEASWEIATAPLVSFHFSCFDEFEPERFKRAHITSSHPVSPALVGLGKNYAARIQKARDHFPDLDYRFNKTANGRPINEIQRELLIDQWDKLPQDADPFAANWCLPGDKLPLADRAEAKIRHRRLTAHLKRAARGMASKILG